MSVTNVGDVVNIKKWGWRWRSREGRVFVDLSKHDGFQTIQSRAKETCQTGPGVMLSQQWMTDLKGKRGFVGNLHGRTSGHFGVVCGAAGSRSSGSDRSMGCLFDGLHSHVSFLDSITMANIRLGNGEKMFAPEMN
ncbi:unnamed protein product [Pleuronectes platessa]|uniref:Uncharacterized protein n=1 Tax=Pleuronectes platessa TaxID=8262 RepID=A0A9N7YH50_PLEPL|nr:unnamed protein product [Pleuronectes platessa]